MSESVTITVNGTPVSHDVEARALLVQYLRDEARLTGTHVGCDTSQCGACTVLLDGHAVKSCTVFAVQAAGHDVQTIEGVAGDDALHPVQAAFVQEHGLQCGFCTPGFVMATKYLLERNPDPSDDEIREALDGNLCRCTGYVNIIRAVRTAAAALRADGSRS